MHHHSFDPEARAPTAEQQSLFTDTIFALSSGGLPSGVAVVRLSGPHVRSVAETVCGGVPAERKAALRRISDGAGRQIDRGLALFFPAPNSFTGEDCLELHLHGGKAVVAAMLAALARMPGLRQADAGEFTRRAFLNGNMDLTGAEALADLVNAETEAQRRLALENAEGRQHALYAGWRQRLLHARAMIEAELDFADEGDVPGAVADAVWRDMDALRREIEEHIEGYRAAEIIRDGFRVVLVGAPNAGKSSLLNALARRDVAIVTEVAGTTRDLVEVALDLDGIKVLVTDTAGIRATDDVVESIGVERARGAAARAHLVIELREPCGPGVDVTVDAPRIRVRTKADTAPDAAEDDGWLSLSALTGSGMATLGVEIARQARLAVDMSGAALPSRMRHVECLREGVRHIEAATLRTSSDLELRAEELRLAAKALGRVIGSDDVEDVLGTIFSQFCIGK